MSIYRHVFCIVGYPSDVILTARTADGHRYWEVATSCRILNRPRKMVLLYLGRLDGLAPLEVEEKRQQVRALGHPALSLRLDALLAELGHPLPLPSLKDVDLATVRSYGVELALVKIADEFQVVAIIEKDSPKGGGPPLGKTALAMAIYANVRPGSYRRFREWYARSPLPLFLNLPPEQFSYEATLNTLDYLQPERTREWESRLYAKVRQTFHYDCERVDIDSTVEEVDGKRC